MPSPTQRHLIASEYGDPPRDVIIDIDRSGSIVMQSSAMDSLAFDSICFNAGGDGGAAVRRLRDLCDAWLLTYQPKPSGGEK